MMMMSRANRFNYYMMRADKGCDASVNEDAGLANATTIAVSDGAGGYGIFADEWSAYLLRKLPVMPFKGFDEFDKWTDEVGGAYFDAKNAELHKYKPNQANKFLNEGSCATLAAVWKMGRGRVSWCSYGDSAVFVFRVSTGKMVMMSCDDVSIFARNPFLIDCMKAQNEKHFKYGEVCVESGDWVFAASDALACMLSLAYMTGYDIKRVQQLAEGGNRLATFANNILEWCENRNFYNDLLLPILQCRGDGERFTRLLHGYYDCKILDNDDYTFTCFKVGGDFPALTRKCNPKGSLLKKLYYKYYVKRDSTSA